MSKRAAFFCVVISLGLVAACEPNNVAGEPTQAQATATQAPSPSSAVQPSAAASPSSSAGGNAALTPGPGGSPAIAITGSTVHIAGLGTGQSEQFPLPAGEAEVDTSICASNFVGPIIRIFDSNNTPLAYDTDAVYELKGVVGGKYYIQATTNPDCSWTVDFKPK